MSVSTTVTLDDDVLDRLQRESRSRGVSLQDTLNDFLRTALVDLDKKPQPRTLGIKPVSMSYNAELNHDSVEALLEHGEGQQHR